MVKLTLKSLNKKKFALIAWRTSEAFLCLLISDTRKKKVGIESEINTYLEHIRQAVNKNKWSQIESWCLSAVERALVVTKEMQKQ